ncbi:hypothetical protein INT45_008584 [Circinella minor]|uniref:Transposase domain-containing protein n=1 Tax=Circinella minor TaxID=1195481 RepID=A0A8H7RPC4_9FUNG|nr:hypothetical protein INT45_008584 [Circinella minor]
MLIDRMLAVARGIAAAVEEKVVVVGEVVREVVVEEVVVGEVVVEEVVVGEVVVGEVVVLGKVVVVVHPNAFRALSRNNVIDPEVFPEAPDTTTVNPFIVSGSEDFSMDYNTEQVHRSIGSFEGDFNDFDFGDSSNGVQEYEQRTDVDEDNDNMTDDNYMDDDDNEPGPSDLHEVSDGIEDEESMNEYVDLWDKEPPLPTNVPIVENVYPFTDLPKHKQKSYELYSWIQQFNISREAYVTLLAMLNKWIMKEGFENVPIYSPAKSEARLERMFNVKETKYRICPKHCRLFPVNSTDPCKCNASQFKQNGNPIETMSYFPLSRQLAMFIANIDIRESIYEKVNYEADPGMLTDIFDGSIYQKLKPTLFPNRSPTNIDLAVSLFVDGYKAFLRPLINELRVLEDAGMIVDCAGGPINVKVHCLLASGDIIGVQELIHHSGCMSSYGCRQCRIATVREISPAGRGYGRYYTGTIEMSTPRTDEEFKGDENEFGISKATDFAQLKSFHGYSFFGLDELHLIGANVMKRIWQMVSGDFATDVNTNILLPKQACSAIGSAITESSATIPSAIFEGSFRDVYKKAGLMRSVDWIVFLQAVVPTLVF